MASLIDPKRIRTDLGTQMRITMNEDVVKEYAEAMQAGYEFPALRAFFDDIFVHRDTHLCAEVSADAFGINQACHWSFP